MMNQMNSGAMSGGIWFWTVIGILAVAVIVLLIRTVNKK